mgnify:CR=1 FL=1
MKPSNSTETEISSDGITRRGFLKAGLAAGLVGLSGAYLYESIGDNRTPHLRSWTFPKEDAGLTGPVRIIHISDLHSTTLHPQNTEAIKTALHIVRERNPDLVVVTGDIAEYPEMGDVFNPEPLEGLKNIGVPVIFTPGNHDCYLDKTEAGYSTPQIQQCVPDTLTSIGSNIKLIRNELVTVGTRAGNIHLVGVGSCEVGYPKNAIVSDVGNIGNIIQDNRAAFDDGGLKILLGHEPETLRYIKDQPEFDLGLFGHTHGAPKWLMSASNMVGHASFSELTRQYNRGLNVIRTTDGVRERLTRVLTSNGVGASKTFLKLFGGRVSPASIEELNFV